MSSASSPMYSAEEQHSDAAMSDASEKADMAGRRRQRAGGSPKKVSCEEGKKPVSTKRILPGVPMAAAASRALFSGQYATLVHSFVPSGPASNRVSRQVQQECKGWQVLDQPFTVTWNSHQWVAPAMREGPHFQRHQQPQHPDVNGHTCDGQSTF